MTSEENGPGLFEAQEILVDARMLVHLIGMGAQFLDKGEFESGAICQAVRDVEAKIDQALDIIVRCQKDETAGEDAIKPATNKAKAAK